MCLYSLHWKSRYHIYLRTSDLDNVTLFVCGLNSRYNLNIIGFYDIFIVKFLDTIPGIVEEFIPDRFCKARLP